MKTQWKDIPAVPTSQEFLDIVLSRTYDAQIYSPRRIASPPTQYGC